MLIDLFIINKGIFSYGHILVVHSSTNASMACFIASGSTTLCKIETPVVDNINNLET